MLYNIRTNWGVKNGRPFHAKAPSGIFYGYGVEHADKEG